MSHFASMDDCSVCSVFGCVFFSSYISMIIQAKLKLPGIALKRTSFKDVYRYLTIMLRGRAG